MPPIPAHARLTITKKECPRNWLHVFTKTVMLYLLLLPPGLQAQDLDVPFVATPPEVVKEMLNMANVGPGDYVIDLGSGDGRIVIAAAQRGAVGHGVDLDPRLVQKAFQNAEKAGVAGRVIFLEEDVFKTDFSMATVVTIYMSRQINRDLRTEFFSRLKPGTRVVSHIFDMGGWKPDHHMRVNLHNIFSWVIPAGVHGVWVWETAGETYISQISQKYQEIREVVIKTQTGEQSWTTKKATISGERMTLTMQNDDGSYKHVYNGRVDGDSITGTVQIHEDGMHRMKVWRANRE